MSDGPHIVDQLRKTAEQAATDPARSVPTYRDAVAALAAICDDPVVLARAAAPYVHDPGPYAPKVLLLFIEAGADPNDIARLADTHRQRFSLSTPGRG